MLPSLSSLQHPPFQKPHQNQPNPQIQPSDLLHSFTTPFQLKQIHAHIIKTNNSISTLPLQRVAHVCGLSRSSFDYARQIIHCVKIPEIILWNSCLKSLAEGDSPEDTVHLFYRLRQVDLLPDTFTCSFVLKACSRIPSLSDGRIVHGFVEKLGFRTDLFLQNTIIHMYACCGVLDDARLLFEKMPQRDVVSWNILITQFTKQGEMGTAKELFDEMPERSVTSWTAMIAGYVQCGNPAESIRLFGEMEEAGARPNEVTVVAVLAACADLGALDLGKRVHEYSDQCGFQRNVRICNTLIDMYIKCGCLEITQKVFNKMEERTVVSWSAMIGGLAMHGKGKEALELFSKMSRIGIRPNSVTFIGLLHACSHMGLVEDGRQYFATMTKDYGIIPQIEHYGCMVDLLSRAGLLQEAHEFIKNMAIKPNGVVWGALLGGCRVHKDIEMGEEVIEHLQELDPLNDGYYVVLSNIYAEAGRWEDAAKVRRLMRVRGVKKTPGWSSITIDGVVHEFVAGDSTHPQAEEIYEKWEELLEQLKLRGYVPDTSVVLLDMDENEKEHVLYRHSEKLAVVFALMNTPPKTPIRIMKNLRVCSDCHAALKLISNIADRQIVVRDRNRFHCFKDGLCSCRDYW
ncbi:pentatricopeptide repeat-containing protein At3g62890-like [Magnolia sinica]|uniref:pentatricopeptide repeat-containing protein At3g62890-like n=1 Tax=Magnolia sinica TaxID=86752 RepID=UPI00265A6B5D|nr:pentatricopeptide repeat-containing protein At3g62890-like [Magnolia sinica]